MLLGYYVHIDGIEDFLGNVIIRHLAADFTACCGVEFAQKDASYFAFGSTFICVCVGVHAYQLCTCYDHRIL